MKTLKQLIEQGKFYYVNSNITDELFKLPENLRTEYKLYSFDQEMSSKDVVAHMKIDGYEPANIYELLSWTEWDRNSFVVGLGSVGRVGGDRYVPCLDGDVSERSLSLDWWDGGWCADCRFLGVRNSSSVAKELELSDTSNLEARVAVLEDYMQRNGQLPNFAVFEGELTKLINRFSMENVSNTPDYILARYLMHCLRAYESLNRAKNDKTIPRRQS